jgi:magnesium transporter
MTVSKPNHRPQSHHQLETAGWHLVSRLPVAASHERVGQVLARLPGNQFDYAGAVYLVDAGGRLLGTVRMTALLQAAAEQPIVELMERALSVHPETDQERIASHALRHGLPAVPVTDRDGRLLGVVPPLVLLDVLRREHVEDLHRLAGIRRESAQARAAIEAPPVRRARDRLPWLLIGLAGSMLATFVVAFFEHQLESRVAIAFFIPGIVYLADAIGTQTEAIAVRGLSLSHIPIRQLVMGELRTGILIGLVLGALSMPGIWLVLGDASLAVSVGLSLLVAGTVATTIGLLFPWLLAQFGRDPAFGSGPIATIVQDVLSLVIYFLVVSLLLF